MAADALPRAHFDAGTVNGNHGTLYGRATTILALKAALLSGTHTEVIGARKFGKSSLLRHVANFLHEQSNCLGIYVPVDSLNCAGWRDFYAWLMAYVLAAAASKNLTGKYTGEGSWPRYKDSPSALVGPAEFFSEIRKRDGDTVVADLLRLLTHFCHRGISTVLLLDEFTFALKYFQDDPARLTALRELAMLEGSGDSKPLTVCVASPVGWENLNSLPTASVSMNFLCNRVAVGGISEEAAHQLLREHAQACHPPLELHTEVINMILDIASTYPFYLKVAGEKAYLQKMLCQLIDPASLELETYGAVRAHMMQYVRACDVEERQALSRITNNWVPAHKLPDSSQRSLLEEGLVKVEGNFIRPFNRLFLRACRECFGSLETSERAGPRR